MSCRIKKGITLISILVSLIILATGIITLLKVYPTISKLSERGKDNATISLISTQIFTLIEEVYSSETNLPQFIEGVFKDFPNYKYRIEFKEEKPQLYRADIEIAWKREGKVEKEFFTYFFGKR